MTDENHKAEYYKRLNFLEKYWQGKIQMIEEIHSVFKVNYKIFIQFHYTKTTNFYQTNQSKQITNCWDIGCEKMNFHQNETDKRNTYIS